MEEAVWWYGNHTHEFTKNRILEAILHPLASNLLPNLVKCSNKHSTYFIHLIHPFFIVLQFEIVQIFVTLIIFPILNGFIYGFHRHLMNVRETSNLKNLMEIHCIEWDIVKSAYFAATLLEAILKTFICLFLQKLNIYFTDYNSYYSLLYSLAGNLQVPAKFWYAYPDLAGAMGTGWSRSAGVWSTGIFWQVTCWYLQITCTHGWCALSSRGGCDPLFNGCDTQLWLVWFLLAVNCIFKVDDGSQGCWADGKQLGGISGICEKVQGYIH